MQEFAWKRWFVPVCAAALFACDDGKAGRNSAPPSDGTRSFTISGTITAAAGMAVDGDVADPAAPLVANDTPEQAQVLSNAATVAGWVDAERDPDDWYRASLSAGQRVTLVIADAGTTAGVDLDLCLFVASDRTPVDCSVGTAAVEQLEVQEAGEYLVLVHAARSSSNYALTFGVGTAAVETLRAGDEFVPGEVLVTFHRPEAAIAAARPLATAVERMGLRLVTGDWDRPALLEIPKDTARQSALAGLGAVRRIEVPGAPAALAEKLDTLHAVKALRARAEVATADPNYIRRAFAVPNDPYYVHQWHYPLIGLEHAWNVTTGAPGPGASEVVVAVVDTGVFLGHPDLAGKLVPGYDFISSPSRARDGDGIDPDPDDPGDGAAAGQSSWHGTHVAGTIAASTNDGAGVAGVSWGAKVMPVRALGLGGSGTSNDILNAVRWAAGLSNSSGTYPAQRADVINLSLGGESRSLTEEAVFAAVREAGVIVVAAAGNENTSVPSYPASYAGVVSVSAVDMRLQKAPYSNYGAHVDVAAPGGDLTVDRDGDGYRDGVLSLLVDDADGTRRPVWGFQQGTSMAAPHVSGVVALMKAVCPSLTPAALDALIAAGAITRDLGAPGRDDVFGYGLVDALLAVQAAQAQCGLEPAPALQITPPRLDLGPGQTSATLTASKVGDGALRVTSAASDAAWIVVTMPGTADELGVYVVTVNATGLADGIHRATITFTVEDGAPVAVPVTLRTGQEASGGRAGHVYVLLLDADLEPVAQWDGDGAGGNYSFSFARLPAGTYALVAGTDYDDDGYICDPGEACGSWPTGGLPEPFEVTSDRGGLDFHLGLAAELGLTGASSAPARKAYPVAKVTKAHSRP